MNTFVVLKILITKNTSFAKENPFFCCFYMHSTQFTLHILPACITNSIYWINLWLNFILRAGRTYIFHCNDDDNDSKISLHFLLAATTKYADEHGRRLSLIIMVCLGLCTLIHIFTMDRTEPKKVNHSESMPVNALLMHNNIIHKSSFKFKSLRKHLELLWV